MMPRKAIVRTAHPTDAVNFKDERKVALVNLRMVRSTGQKNLLFGCKVRDIREQINTPAMGCGIADFLDEALRDPKKRAAIEARGEAIYAAIQRAPRRVSGETILHLDPVQADRIGMKLAGAGMKASPAQAGWATFRGPVAINTVQVLLDEFGTAPGGYHLREIESFAPPLGEATLPAHGSVLLDAPLVVFDQSRPPSAADKSACSELIDDPSMDADPKGGGSLSIMSAPEKTQGLKSEPDRAGNEKDEARQQDDVERPSGQDSLKDNERLLSLAPDWAPEALERIVHESGQALALVAQTHVVTRPPTASRTGANDIAVSSLFDHSNSSVE